MLSMIFEIMAFVWLKKELQLKHFFFADCRQERFYTSQWSNKRWLFWGIKTFLMVYWFSWFVAELTPSTRNQRWLIYLTSWGVLGLLVYFIISFAVTTYGLKRGASTSQTKPNVQCVTAVLEDQESAEQHNLNATAHVVELRWFHKIVWIFQATTVNGAIIITATYWALLSPNFGPISINNHAINTVIMILDLSLIDIPVRIFHFIYPLSIGLSYIIFSLILHWTGYESSIYPILNWATQPGFSTGLAAILIFVAIPLIQLAIYSLYCLRVYIASKVGATNDRLILKSGTCNSTFQE